MLVIFKKRNFQIIFLFSAVCDATLTQLIDMVVKINRTDKQLGVGNRQHLEDLRDKLPVGGGQYVLSDKDKQVLKDVAAKILGMRTVKKKNSSRSDGLEALGKRLSELSTTSSK
jgi:hypothetical protein